MGLSNSGILLSENDLNSMEFSFLLRSTFQTNHPSRDHHQYLTVNSQQQDGDDVNRSQQGRDRDRNVMEEDDKDHDHESKLSESSSSSLDKNKVEDDDNGFKTPTTLDHKIPTSLRCPMAPRKPKSRPVTKRKTSRQRRQRLLRDLSYEIQSLFPPDFLVELGGKIKRVRQEREN